MAVILMADEGLGHPTCAANAFMFGEERERLTALESQLHNLELESHSEFAEDRCFRLLLVKSQGRGCFVLFCFWR